MGAEREKWKVFVDDSNYRAVRMVWMMWGGGGLDKKLVTGKMGMVREKNTEL